MTDLEEQLHLIDLQQVDRIHKLVARLQNDLTRWNTKLQAEALLETNEIEAKTLSDSDLEEMTKGKDNGKPITQNDLLNEIEAEKGNTFRHKIRILTSMKDAVWSSSNALRSAHQRRQGLIEESRDTVQAIEVLVEEV